VMIGREAYQNPWLLAELHRAVQSPSQAAPDRAAVLSAYADYVESQLARGERINAMVRPVLGLYHGLPGARAWRRYLSEGVTRPDASAALLLHSLRIVADTSSHGRDMHGQPGEQQALA
jgi:tRNA-dihydrouridine synthase A